MTDRDDDSAVTNPFQPVPLDSDEQPVAAEVVEHHRDRPRIWPTLVLGLAMLPVAAVVSGVVLVAAAVLDGGIEVLQHPHVFQEWVQQFAETKVGLFILVVPGQLVFLSAACCAGWLSPQPTRQRLGLVRGDVPLWTWLIVILAAPAIGYLTSAVMSLVIDDVGESLEMLQNIFRSHSGLFFIVLVVLMSALPGFSEELLFRGYIQRRLLQRCGPWAAIALSTTLFAAAHLDPVHVIGVFPLGLWLGVVAWRCGSIWPSVMCHAANNAVGVVMGQFDELGDEPITLNFSTVVPLMLCVGALLLAVLVLIRFGGKRLGGRAVQRVLGQS